MVWRSRPVATRFPAINADKLRQNLGMTFGRRWSQGYIWPLLDQIGQERISWMMENERPLRDYLPPDIISFVQANAVQAKRVVDTISDTDALQLLPQWLVDLAAGSEKGKQWLQGEFDWLRSLCLERGPS